MACAVRRGEWQQLEEAICRHAYWQVIVQRWLWKIPFAVLIQPEMRPEAAFESPSPQALQDFGWVKEPRSSLSH